MITKLRVGILLAVAGCFLATASNSFADAESARQNKINKLTKDLKKLPERAGPSAKINSLVKKLTKLQPNKTAQYYALGLRKLGLPGAEGEAFALQLSNALKDCRPVRPVEVG